MPLSFPDALRFLPPRSFFALALCGFLALSTIGCNPSDGDSGTMSAAEDLDIETLRQVLRMEGTLQEGQFKVTVPQNDLNVTVDGVSIIPPMGMGSWAAFAPVGDSAMVMGDVVLKEEEVKPIQQVLTEHPLTATALHKHFLREEPRVMYMHIGGAGDEEALAQGVRAVLDRVADLRGGDPAAAEAQTVETTIDTTRIDEILGYEGEENRGVYKVTIGRPDVDVTVQERPVTTFMGLSTWAAWQGTDDEAAVSGDFAMLADEVAPVLQTLAEHDIEVVSIHNHMVQDDPQVFFLHYWGQGPVQELAQGLRAAIDQTGASPSTSTR